MKKAFSRNMSVVIMCLMLIHPVFGGLHGMAQILSPVPSSLIITMTTDSQSYVEGDIATSPVTVEVISTSVDSANLQIDYSLDEGASWQVFDRVDPLVFIYDGNYEVWFREAGGAKLLEKRFITIAQMLNSEGQEPEELVNNKAIYSKAVQSFLMISSVEVPANDTYKAEDILRFGVNFDTSVTVDMSAGMPQIALTIGSEQVKASYLSGSGTSQLTFIYTIEKGMHAPNGISLGSELELNGGEIKSMDGDSAQLTLNNIESTAGVYVDAIAPTITGITASSSGNYVVGDELTFDLSMNEAVIVNKVQGTPLLELLVGGTVRSALYEDTNSSINNLAFRYKIVDGDFDANGIQLDQLKLNGATVKDVAGNALDETLPALQEVITISVNTAPILQAIGNKIVDEETELSFMATAIDSDLPANTLTYSLVDAPSGAKIDPIMGEFTWTPTEAQGPGSYTFIVRVSDGALTDEETITITVNEINTAPVLQAIGNKIVDEETELSFTATAIDSDLPENTLTYSLVDAPSGAKIDPITGEFTWTPTEAQGPGSYTFIVRVSDGALTDEETITIKVNEVNTPTTGGSATPSIPPATPSIPTHVDISFETNGGTIIDTLNLPYNVAINDLPVPIKEGYKFEGWYQDKNFTIRWEDGTKLTKNMTLNAKWVALTDEPEKEQPTQPDESEKPVIIFSDIENHWANDIIGEIAALGIINGYPDGRFGPNDLILREHIAVMIQRAIKLAPTREVNTFNDVPEYHPNYEAIMALANAGILDGYNGNYNPDAPMTRAELAKVLVLVFNLTPGGESTFTDISEDHWSYSYIVALADAGIALGDNRKFSPNEPVTRAQFVAFLYRALNL